MQTSIESIDFGYDQQTRLYQRGYRSVLLHTVPTLDLTLGWTDHNHSLRVKNMHDLVLER